MGTKTTIEEHKFLVSAEEDFLRQGQTLKRCPRCGKEIICEEKGASYTIRCKTQNCIRMDVRGV